MPRRLPDYYRHRGVYCAFFFPVASMPDMDDYLLVEENVRSGFELKACQEDNVFQMQVSP